jgi:hypothetical protein
MLDANAGAEKANVATSAVRVVVKVFISPPCPKSIEADPSVGKGMPPKGMVECVI